MPHAVSLFREGKLTLQPELLAHAAEKMVPATAFPYDPHRIEQNITNLAFLSGSELLKLHMRIWAAKVQVSESVIDVVDRHH